MIEHLPERLDLFAMAEAGRALRGQLKLASLERVLPLVASRDGELKVSLELGKDQDGTHYLAGTVKGSLVLQCQRCLESMDYPLDVEFLLGLVNSQQEMNRLPERFEPFLLGAEPALIAEVVSDEVLLALPIAPLHTDMSKCREVAPEYREAAGSERENPFAVLAKLKL